MFSLRAHALVTFMTEMKLMWSNRTGTFMLFANHPNGTTGRSARYLTNGPARRLAPGESLADFSTPAAPEFDCLGLGAWAKCIAPQLKVAIVAYMLSLLAQPTYVAQNLTKHRWFETIGCDFLIDEDFKAHFLECNCRAEC